MKLKSSTIRRIVKEEVRKVLGEGNELNFTVKSTRIDIFEDVLRRDNLDHIIQKLRDNKRGQYYYAELNKEEAEEIADAIKSYLDYEFADLSFGDRRALESILNSLPYLMRF